MYKTSSTYGNFYQSNIYYENIKYLQKTKIKTLKSDLKCIICQNNMKNNIIRTLPCEHKYHIECIDQWMIVNSNCPICRKII